MQMTMKDLIAKSGKTQTKIATELGVHQTLVSLWACGKCKPTLSILKRLAECIGCTTDEIIECLSK